MENIENCEKPSEPAVPEQNCVVYPKLLIDLFAEPYRGSFQQLLYVNTGKFVTIEFMLSTCEIRPISGIIESVNGRYVVLHNPKTHCRVAGDAWTIKTVTFPCCN